MVKMDTKKLCLYNLEMYMYKIEMLDLRLASKNQKLSFRLYSCGSHGQTRQTRTVSLKTQK